MTPKQECEIVLEALIPAAEHLLKKNGDFYPMGAVLTRDSEISFTAVCSDDEFPDTQSIMNNLVLSHKQMAEKNEIKASGIAWNAAVSTPEGKQSKAMIISLEHQEGYCVIAGLPYKLGLFQKVKLGELFAQNGKNDIF